MWRYSVLFLALNVLPGCVPNAVKLDAERHISVQGPSVSSDIPTPVGSGFSLPPPKAQPKLETYSVVVNNVKVQDLLFTLARDAKFNVDIHPGLTGSVTLNALEQTLPQLLTRISKQVDMRFELDGPNLVVMPDSPILQNYTIDYVNLSRDTSSTILLASQIGSAVGNAEPRNNQSGGSGSFAKIESSSKNRFWESLIQNVKDILRETDKVFPEGKAETSIQQTNTQTLSPGASIGLALKAANTGGHSNHLSSNALGLNATEQTTVKTTTFREAASVIANMETGIMSVRATSRQHEKIQAFLSKVMSSAKRQVLIEATIVEVELTRNYQQGVDWSALNVFDTGLKIVTRAVGGVSAANAQMIELNNSSDGKIGGAVRFLESFGTVKVLSSPKLSVLNNQTAVMKVVDDNIYFTYQKEEKEGTANSGAKTTITSTVHSVPVGLVLTITPLIAEDDTVMLNIRPSLSRVIGHKEDPSLDVILGTGGSLRNTIPIIRARELDSVMRVSNGNIAVMGGLMEDMLDNRDDAVPGISNISLVGSLFQNRNDTKKKTELVIFIRPTVIRTASIDGDYRNFFSRLPKQQFFDESINSHSPKLAGEEQ